MRGLFPLFISVLLLCSGCVLEHQRWPSPQLAAPLRLQAKLGLASTLESTYYQATQAQLRHDSDCIDLYLSCLRQVGMAAPRDQRSCEIQRSALINLLATSQDHGRYHPGLGIQFGRQNELLPIRTIGFKWQPNDFDRIHVVGPYRNPRLPNPIRSPGYGVPVVVERIAECENEPYADAQPFAGTAIYVAATATSPEQLLIVNPLNMDHDSGISRDLTSPYAFAIRARDRLAVLNFIYPQRSAARSHLFMAQPYQPGKIPVVLVHGLVSDHTTWTSLADHWNACPEFRERFQVWYFQYPTGIPFVDSASALREQLESLCCQLDPAKQDHALSNIVLVGHSMGGLISKLQVTECDQQIWRQISRVPIDRLNASEENRQLLHRWFQFHANPRVQRVCMIAAPHGGSPLAERLIGKVSARLVREPPFYEQLKRDLVRDNQNAFLVEAGQQLTTSISLLDPGDPILKGMRQLPYQPGTAIDSIIGNGRLMEGYGPSDGVVPVTNAIDPYATSEQYLESTHNQILEEPELHQLLTNLLLGAQ